MSNNAPNTSGAFSFFGAQNSGTTAQPTSNLFGQNTQSSTSGAPSPFGGGGTQSNLFGSAGNNQSASSASPSANQSSFTTQPSSGSSLFGGGAAAAGGGTSGFSFSKPAEKQQDTSGSNAPSLFSTPNKPSTNQNQGTSLFANLGSPAASSAPTGTATPTAANPSSSNTGVSTTPAGPPPSTGLFGNLGQSMNKGGSIFGASQTTSAPADQASRPSTSNIFGGLGSTSSPSAPGTSTATTGSLFGKIGANTGSSAANTGGANTANKDGSKLASAPPLTAADASGSSVQQSDAVKSSTALDKPSLFAMPASTNSSTPSLFANLNQNQPQQKDAQNPAVTTSSSPFTGFGLKKDGQKDSAPSSTGLFQNLNQPKAGETTTRPQDQGSTTSTSTSAPAPAASLFSAPSRPEQPAGTSAAAGTTSAPSSTPASAPTIAPATLGSSTSGPAPTVQSRLKNKSMDEIITRWASDLAKYQKEFQAHAEKVAEWDRLLLENGNILAQIYSKTFQAERDTAEVEKQISAVEGQQDEMRLWLDRYEREVDEMMSRQIGQGEGLQGPDQERERTYKTAERVSERLDDMGKDLTSMIDEINAASSVVSKSSKPDDPLSQIVRVLNGHLSQLQLIDEGTAALQSKVTAAQQQSQRLGSRVHGGYNDAADSFYRSYGRGSSRGPG